jgi:Sulfatase-modifying factor enzyme 1
MDGMAWIPGATFLTGSDRHYPEEAPAHKATVGGFWIDAAPVTHLRAELRLAARRLRAIISPAMHGARRPVKRDRGVKPAVIPTN